MVSSRSQLRCELCLETAGTVETLGTSAGRTSEVEVLTQAETSVLSLQSVHAPVHLGGEWTCPDSQMCKACKPLTTWTVVNARGRQCRLLMAGVYGRVRN
jgi:hypothetical protein